MDLFETIGELKADNLISGTKVGVLTRGIKLAAGQGLLKRGTLLYEKGDGTYATFDASVEKIVPSGILTDDTDTGTSESDSDVVAEEYITGTFNPEAVIVASGTTLEDYTEELRRLGIFLEEVK
ncbi:MAG: head decoration protein [Clostridiales bacterium]|nr:head decoration protein [Eubacterium sp.]MDD7349740.1 head decoration protein [Clostridiales bacterium]